MSEGTIRSSRPLLFYPLPALLFSLAGSCLYAIYAALRFSGDKLFNQYFYVVPIVVPFIAFLLDRAEGFRRRKTLQISIDVFIVLTAMWRVIGDVPYISGHALFLTYSLLSSRSRVMQITSAMVMMEVIYLKFFVWQDRTTLISGIVLGSTAALIARR